MQFFFIKQMCFYQNVAGYYRTGITIARTNHGEEQETHRFGGLYRCAVITRDRMFTTITSKSLSEATVIPRESINH